jgi:hypothetical protein
MKSGVMRFRIRFIDFHIRNLRAYANEPWGMVGRPWVFVRVVV